MKSGGESTNKGFYFAVFEFSTSESRNSLAISSCTASSWIMRRTSTRTIASDNAGRNLNKDVLSDLQTERILNSNATGIMSLVSLRTDSPSKRAFAAEVIYLQNQRSGLLQSWFYGPPQPLLLPWIASCHCASKAHKVVGPVFNPFCQNDFGSYARH